MSDKETKTTSTAFRLPYGSYGAYGGYPGWGGYSGYGGGYGGFGGYGEALRRSRLGVF